jgi:hypothetical protein
MVQAWSIDRLVFYARNPRKNDAVVDRMCSSIREFGFKIPVLARSDAKSIEIEDIEARVSELERAAEIGKPEQRRS